MVIPSNIGLLFITYDLVYSFITKMACRVTNMRIKRTALMHSKRKHKDIVEPTFVEIYDAFQNLSAEERKCRDAYVEPTVEKLITGRRWLLTLS